jgi:Flp pilus assembly pilin Flp
MISYWQFCVSHVHSRYGRSNRRVSPAEYALLVAFLAIACVAAMAFVNRGASIHFSPAGWSL